MNFFFALTQTSGGVCYIKYTVIQYSNSMFVSSVHLKFVERCQKGLLIAIHLSVEMAMMR